LFTASTDYGNFDDAAIARVSLKDHRVKTLVEHGGEVDPKGWTIFGRRLDGAAG
jgi:hypothetical protein